MSNLTPIIKDSFIQFSGAVLQSRALVDARDCIKPSARQIFYCMYTDKFRYNKPFQKTLKAIGSAFRMYIHGDSSAEGVIMRAGQPFSMRYPLIEVEGSYGTLLSSESWAAPRYTSARLSPLAEYLFKDIDKEVIEEWRDNYDNTEKYPSVLPSKGFYNLVNGTFGLGVGASASIPQYNLRELNKALETLLLNPDCDFNKIYCAPDFATGAILYNETEVKDSMKNGNGFACKLRSVVEFDSKDRCFIVTEIPYMVYTETICEQLEKILDDESNPGIERFNDLTGEKPLIKIYLSKKANPDKVLRYLYKNTSLQYYYGINFTMLDHGRFPRVFTWKEMLQAHIDHEKEVYRNGFNFDLHKINDRIHIIDGILICLASISEVVDLIKSSTSTAAASIALQQKFLLDEVQTKAVLDMKLSRLAHLEVKKLEDERISLQSEAARIESILNSTELFNNELINGWRDVAEKFGDARRTKIMNLDSDEKEEPIEKKYLSISITNQGAIMPTEVSTLYTQKRNGVGTKFKLEPNEYIIENITDSNTGTMLLFSAKGNFYPLKLSQLQIGEKQYLSNFIPNFNDSIIATTSVSKSHKYIIFLTRRGVIKKTLLSEYNITKGTGAIAIKLDNGDLIQSVLFCNEERLGILSKYGNFIMIDSSPINATGRVSKGVCGMKLDTGDLVVSARLIDSTTKEFLSISTDGYTKRTPITDFKLTNRATKGSKIQRSESMCDFIPISNDKDILIISSTSQLRTNVSEIPLSLKGALGTKAIKLAEKSKVIKLSKLE